MSNTLYWMTNDLRLDDNPALARASWSRRLLMVYCVDSRWFKAHRYHVSAMGSHRWSFLQQSLRSLDDSLRAMGQHLRVEFGVPAQQLGLLIRSHGIKRLVCARQVGSDEIEALRILAKEFPALKIDQIDAVTLFDLDSLPAPLESLKSGYTSFRKLAETIHVPAALCAPTSLPASRLPPQKSYPVPSKVTVAITPAVTPAVTPAANDATPFIGGESAGRRHMQSYFSTDLPLHYKGVRNKLDGWENSSKMSAWLSLGCLSPRRLKACLEDYEHQRGANKSTQRLYLKLLWREYFHWLALHAGNKLFSYKGIAGRSLLTCVHPERYQKWCHGTTPFPLVNACMRQLKQTGYLSNRGRQIAASCFVNELGMDWRYGAAWFEHQLIDYDVAVNWGNWQFIAGVSADPRGGRHLNLDKQAATYDPDGSYRARWAPDTPSPTLDSVDAADWPIG
jgi:deoxyribodipyrimidine photo-lyase